jgi:hypothetical protein
MGRYQQWLQYQEIHKRLSSQVEALEAELAKLQECLDQLGQHQGVASFTANPVMQALLAQMTFQADPLNSNASYTLETHNAPENDSDESADLISPALGSREKLPNFELYEIREPIPVDNLPPSFFNHQEIELLPEDLIAFLDEHEQTDPQLELPWWLRNITISSKDEQAGRPIDQSSIRTNRLVQRWIERWGRQSSTAIESTENKEEGSSE